MKRTSSRLVAGQAVTLLFVAMLFAALAAAQVTTPAPDYPVSVQTNVCVKMRDGVSLVGDIYRPKTDGRLPVLLTRTPYNRKDPTTGMYLAAQGFVVILQDTRWSRAKSIAGILS